MDDDSGIVVGVIWALLIAVVAVGVIGACLLW